MEKRKRRCFFKLKKQNELQPGWFHKWGLGLVETEYTNTNYTAGIVEDDLGQVHLVYPEFITFK